MGPAHRSHTEELPSRPRFSLDAKSIPWTDGVGSQEQYAERVREWCRYHDLLANNCANKIPHNVRGTLLKTQLFGRARDLVRSLDPALI